MTAYLRVQFEKDVGRLDPDAREHRVASEVERLDRYAAGRGLVPLGRFVVDSNRVDEDLEEAGEWFDAHDVLHAAERLAGACADDPPSFAERVGHTAELLHDLNSIAMLSRRAAGAKVRVRLTLETVAGKA